MRITHWFRTGVCFWRCRKSYAHNQIANALRETWGNDERLRSHDSALSQQLQSGHLAGGVHWSAEDNEWREADYDCEESLDPWSCEWCDTEGYDDKCFPEETNWTENYYETSDYDNNDNTFAEHSRALLDQLVETQEEDTSKLDCTRSDGCSKRSSRHEQTNLDSGPAAHERCAQSRGYFPCLKGQSMDVDQGKGMSRGKKGTFPHRKGKAQRKKQGKDQSETSWTVSSVPRTTLGS